jgi:hypothetical protein
LRDARDSTPMGEALHRTNKRAKRARLTQSAARA